MCLTGKNFGLQEENINISKPQGNTIMKTVWGRYLPQKERELDWWTERGSDDALLYEKGG